MVDIGVVGATGYTGEEIVKIISRHPGAQIKTLSALVDRPVKISLLFPSLIGRCGIVCKALEIEEVSRACDIIFLALPHKVSMRIAPEFLKRGKRVIDLSADYRLPAGIYKKWYGQEHTDRGNINKAVYGLPELYRDDIKKAHLIANPGCYPTSIILAAAPVVESKIALLEGIIADSKSGLTGAGRKADVSLIFPEINENLKAYKANVHQHKPEIDLVLTRLAGKEVGITFTPHLVPLNRGILSTLYFTLRKGASLKRLISYYRDFYKDEPFVRILTEGLPQVKDVVNTNFCDIGISLTGSRLIVVSCIDNILKGAAGQAVQNMNIICGFNEAEGLLC